MPVKEICMILHVLVVGLPMIKKFLNLLPPGAGLKEREKLEHMPPEFQIDELFDVPGVGTVVGGRISPLFTRLVFEITMNLFLGLLTQGIVTEGMRLKLGPFENGSFRTVTVSSIKRNRAPCRLVIFSLNK